MRFPDILGRAMAGGELSAEEGYRLVSCSDDELPALLRTAEKIRDRRKGRTVTYSRKIFLPLTNFCRNRCSYCDFRKEPGSPGAWMMTLEEVGECLELGKEHGCKEALICLGDKPELLYESYGAFLKSLGYRTSVQYVRETCWAAMEAGLLPHTNAGVLSLQDMRDLHEVNGSLGLMLENCSPRLGLAGMCHFRCPDKRPQNRIRMISQAGELRIPFTTGILIGIGETCQERVDSLLAIRELQRKYGHIQEVIIQNFRAKASSEMKGLREPGADELIRTVSTARLLLAEMNLQVPPNLNPLIQRSLLRAGINDWGGISPVTRDYVNPEAAWPDIHVLENTCREEGFALKERLAVYEGFIDRPGFVRPSMRSLLRKLRAEISAPRALSYADR